MKKLGLPNDTKMDNLLLMYLHYQESLPVEILEFMSAKCQVDLDIGAQICYAPPKRRGSSYDSSTRPTPCMWSSRKARRRRSENP